jgi:hypothetical protein
LKTQLILGLWRIYRRFIQTNGSSILVRRFSLLVGRIFFLALGDVLRLLLGKYAFLLCVVVFHFIFVLD